MRTPFTMFFGHNVFAFIALYILFVKGQAPPIVVDVGLQGSFYSPGTVSVATNATVVFEFYGDVHTVTQSSFADPCAPLPGGFHSGFIGMGLNSSAPVKVWSLVVTDVSAPIWYFCAVTSPTFHCSVGMVGVINPPSQAMYSQFSSAAKLVTTTPVINATPVLTGQGAFATTTPTPTSLSVTPSPSSTPSVSSILPTSTSATSTPSTSTPSSTNTAASSTTTHLGAIVGGAIGGIVALTGLIVAVWFFFIRRKPAPKSFQSDDSLRYDPVRVQPRSEVFSEAPRTENLYHNTSVMSNTDSSMPSTRLNPVRRPSGPVLLESPYLRRQESAPSDLASSSSNPTSTRPILPDQPSNVDIRALAQEVAAVLYQNRPVSARNTNSTSQDLDGQQQPALTVQNHDDLEDTSRTTDHPPPRYQAASGPSIGSIRKGRRS